MTGAGQLVEVWLVYRFDGEDDRVTIDSVWATRSEADVYRSTIDDSKTQSVPYAVRRWPE